jgi:hypothetical protein
MKKLIITIMLAACLAGCDQQNQFDLERQRRLAAERQAAEKEASSDGWQAVSFALCFGSVILLVIGASLGSAAKKNAKPRD